MQGQRGIGSFTETLDINHTSASSSAVGQQVCWNNVQNAAENRLSSCIIAPDEIGITYINPSGQERQNVSRLSFGEPGSSSSQNEVGWNEQKGDHIWSSSVSPFARNSLSLETRRIEPSNHLSLDGSTANPMIRENSTQNINLNADYMASGSRNCPPDLSKSTRTENEPFQAPWSGGYLEEDYEDRIGFPPEGRRSSCKRKSPEVNVGESSTSGSRRYFQHGETSARPGVANGSASNLSMSAPSEQVDPRINVQPQGFAYDSLQNSTSAGSAESSHRNFRMRINPSSQPESGPPPLFPTGNAFRLASSSSSQRSSRLVPVDNSFNLRSAPGADRITQSQLALIHLHAPPRSVQPFRWGSASVSGPGSSSSSVVSENRDAPFEESSSRGMGRNLLDHPRLSPATEMRHLVQNPTHRSSVSGNLSAPGHIASASRTGTSSVVPSDPPFVPPANPPSRYPRRLSEYVRRSLFSSIGTESGGQSGSHPPLRSGPSSPEMLQAPGANNQDQHQPSVRSTSWMGRQGDGVLAMPHPLRNAVASGEGRRGRLVSEIRSVLDLMRRGEGLRVEDVMILDQSVLFNIADIHDRHRDMRLDVDNMSYEELLALEERIGNVSTGLSEEKILGKLEQRKYSDLEPDKKQEEPCCICQEEYNNEEDIGKLDCGHIFHRECIKQWLTHKNLCPICKTTGLAT